MLLSWDKIEILNAPSSVLFENSDLARAAGEGTSVLSVIISPCFMHCLICELAHSCTELDQTFQLCRINFCFLFAFTRLASASARMTNQVQISLAEPSQTHVRALVLPWLSQRPRSTDCRAWNSCSTRSIVGCAHSAPNVREVKLRETGWGESEEVLTLAAQCKTEEYKPSL